jgi:hypothetical protein
MFGLGSSPFARRYLGNRGCFLFLRLLRCFSSPRSPPRPMDSVGDIRPLRRMGSPIQRSPDQCLFSGSPRLIAAIHVFHRLSTPRHPPFALSSLVTNIFGKMLFSPASIFIFQRTSLGHKSPRLKAPVLSRALNLELFLLGRFAFLSAPALRPLLQKNGGGERDRTDDLLRAKQALSQLSYTPTTFAWPILNPEFAVQRLVFHRSERETHYSKLPAPIGLVGLVGIEPTTSRLSGVRSNRD